MKRIYTDAKKAELVTNAEARLGIKLFYTPEYLNKPVVVPIYGVVKTATTHEANCMCEVCFMIRLDRLVISSEKSLNDMKNSLETRVTAETVCVIDENPYTEPFEAAVINVSTIPEYKGSR